MTQELTDCILKNGITAKEIREAYYRVCGVIEERVAGEQVMKTVVELKRMIDAHFPLNRIATFIGDIESLEHGDSDYLAFVQTLDITDREKVMFSSLLSKKRSRVLSISVFNTRTIRKNNN